MTAVQQDLYLEVTCCVIPPASAIVEVIPNSEREVDVRDMPPTVSLILPWPPGDDKPVMHSIVILN